MSQQGGEKELILGNTQLISLFFIVVALCGVFFAMGYMVRGNSLKGTVSTTGDASVAASDAAIKRQQPEPPRETAESLPSETAPPAPEPSRVETHPAEDNPAAGASVEPKTLPHPEPRPPLKPEPKSDSAPAAAIKPTTPESGATYVQVGALPLTDAETMVKTLREQHLPASIAPSSKENLFRVWVGPYHLTSEVAEAKAKLKTLGFSNTIVQKQQ
jgi:cell division septation protein DedD